MFFYVFYSKINVFIIYEVSPTSFLLGHVLRACQRLCETYGMSVCCTAGPIVRHRGQWMAA